MEVTNRQFHNLKQGSPEWLELRQNYLTASEASAAAGCSKYKKRDALIKEKVLDEVPVVSAAQQRIFDKGHATENACRPIIEGRIGEELYPAVMTCEVDGLKLLASMDGMTIMGDVLWEHKMVNESLLAQVATGELDEHYALQLEQQLLVSGAEKALFSISNGDEESEQTIEYVSNPELQAKLIASWKQFVIDKAAYADKLINGAAVDVAEPVTTLTIFSLPTIEYTMNGLSLTSNMEVFKQAALELVDKSKQPLKTDQDFADAESMIKVFKDAEKKLSTLSKQVLGEVEDINSFSQDLAFIGEQIRQARLASDKQIKNRKAAIKAELIADAQQEIDLHRVCIEEVIAPVRLPATGTHPFSTAIKGKRSVSSIKSSLNDAVAELKISMDKLAEQASDNLKILAQHEKHRFLFKDLDSLAFKPTADFAALVTTRISDYEQEQAVRAKAAPSKTASLDKSKSNLNQLFADISPETPASTMTIPLDEYHQLKADSRLLAALKAAGVEQWPGYEQAVVAVQKAVHTE